MSNAASIFCSRSGIGLRLGDRLVVASFGVLVRDLLLDARVDVERVLPAEHGGVRRLLHQLRVDLAGLDDVGERDRRVLPQLGLRGAGSSRSPRGSTAARRRSTGSARSPRRRGTPRGRPCRASRRTRASPGSWSSPTPSDTRARARPTSRRRCRGTPAPRRPAAPSCLLSAPHSFTRFSISLTLSALFAPAIDSVACATLYCHRQTFLFVGAALHQLAVHVDRLVALALLQVEVGEDLQHVERELVVDALERVERLVGLADLGVRADEVLLRRRG